MPNHCFNVLTVRGSDTDVASFEAKARGEEEALSFQAFVPMPQSVLSGPTGGGTFARVKQGAWYDLHHVVGVLNLKAPEGGFQEQDAWLKEKVASFGYEVRTFSFGTRENGEIVELTGDEISWYEWRCNNWGTKWDCYDLDLEPTYGAGRGNLVIPLLPPGHRPYRLYRRCRSSILSWLSR